MESEAQKGDGGHRKGSKFNGRLPVSKTGRGGSNPSSPANVMEEKDRHGGRNPG